MKTKITMIHNDFSKRFIKNENTEFAWVQVFLPLKQTSQSLINSQGSWLALQVASGTLAALLILVLVVVVGSKFFGQQEPPSLLQEPSISHLPRRQSSGSVDMESSPTLPPPPPSSVLYSCDGGELVGNKPGPQEAWSLT